MERYAWKAQVLDGQLEDYYVEKGLEIQSWIGQSGYPALLYDWVLEQEAAGCDRYILSMDQLLYGGLVASGWRKPPQSRTARLWLCRIFWKACCRRWLSTPITRSGYWTA